MKSLFIISKKEEKEKKKINAPINKKKFISTKIPNNNLVKSTVIILTIKNKYLSLFTPIMPKSFLSQYYFLMFSELNEKYKDKTLDFIKISKIAPHSPVPYSNEISEKKNKSIDIINETINLIEEDTDDLININSKLSDSDYSKEKIFLNNKRKNEINNKEKKKVFNMQKIHEKTKKIFFEKKKFNNAGRKKKNSGEYGAHNKFSNDNIMRKLKNKVIESARKLISKTIKDESNSRYDELHKIGGVFSQELNIKFNFWFHLQKFKDIFQFKCSSKYSRDPDNANKLLINNIYSKENINKFPLTIKLLEMKFCQYYHEIFLEKNPIWINVFKIKKNENYYDITYFFNSIRTSPEYNLHDDEIYIQKITRLADDYEKFFLLKNPRKFIQRKSPEINEKNEEIKKILDYLEQIDGNSDELKIKFLDEVSKYKNDILLYSKK